MEASRDWIQRRPGTPRGARLLLIPNSGLTAAGREHIIERKVTAFHTGSRLRSDRAMSQRQACSPRGKNTDLHRCRAAPSPTERCQHGSLLHLLWSCQCHHHSPVQGPFLFGQIRRRSRCRNCLRHRFNLCLSNLYRRRRSLHKLLRCCMWPGQCPKTMLLRGLLHWPAAWPRPWHPRHLMFCLHYRRCT